MDENQLWKVASDMTPQWLDIIVTVFIATLASTGFWSFIQSKSNKKSNTDELILGLAHDRIVSLGSEYLKRGWISNYEYDNFIKYLYDPYKEFGGNGLAEKIKNEVEELPIRISDMLPKEGQS